MATKNASNLHPEATFLGKQTSYPSSYDNTVLVAVPRILNRESYGITGNEFVGMDVWHGYEVSCLLNNGLPVVGILKVAYDAKSEAIVESKSFKLYLNSFNNEKLGDTFETAKFKLLSTIKEDLSALLKVDVEAEFHSNYSNVSTDFTDFPLLENEVDLTDVVCDIYKEKPELLVVSGKSGELKVASQLLRSRCKVTSQPDWGNIFIYINGDKLPDLKGLLQYLVSFREENHFHEEVCEMIYSRLMNIFNPEALMVTCLYTRRGGLDICPVRASSAELLTMNLRDVSVLTDASFRQ